MAEGGLYDPQFMTVSKNGTERKVPFSDSLKNSSTLKDWIEHEKRVVEIVLTTRNMEKDYQSLKTTNPFSWTDVGNFCLAYWDSKEKLKKAFELYLPMLKEKHQGDRRLASRKLNSEFEARFSEWCHNACQLFVY